MGLNLEELRDFLDEKVDQYNTPDFIDQDPIQIPHLYSIKEDIEIAGFLTANISWGNRKMILRNSKQMMGLMGNSPYDFIVNHKPEHLDKIDGFVHRTFNSNDLKFFIASLKNLYIQEKGLEGIFNEYKTQDSLQPAIHQLKTEIFSIPHQTRTRKHVADPLSGSAAKKINMFLRWMVRKDNKGVDFGIWNSISPSILSCPLDVHSGRVARKLGLITRNQHDSKAVAELDMNLRKMDRSDPVKYDFALFGLGVYEGF
jgi:uncharacterized protein (TIGR02757 family)